MSSQELIQTLRNCQSRGEATNMIRDFKRNQLEELAKELIIDKRLNKQRLIEKIVETTVGNRLCSEALEKLDLGNRSF